MDALTQQLMQQLSGDGLSKISKRVGADEKTIGSALSAAMPLLVSALAKNASKPNGAQALHQALSEDHDGSVLNDLSEFLGQSPGGQWGRDPGSHPGQPAARSDARAGTGQRVAK